MVLNKQLLLYLEEKEVDVDVAVLYLLGVYFDLDTSKLPELTKKQVNVLDIVDKNIETDDIIWKIQLFEQQENKWEWVNDFRKKFRDVRLDSGGSQKDCIHKMQSFFSENPDVRRQDVMDAADIYLKDFIYGKENPKYLQRADYFIYKGKGTDRTSRLEQYIEILKEVREQGKAKHDIR